MTESDMPEERRLESLLSGIFVRTAEESKQDLGEEAF
jgi:hypothetical protein